ncbi:MBL fold metallo-hydrolase RNA specificity domain-containing protein [Nitrososphaera sp.]|uniref:MBL fold metallo-hydrolase RNA specificity domain-containing protein n=1 Tax=Nitrososphaera sp. TaxID=1971748 RepID=UPI00307E21E4
MGTTAGGTAESAVFVDRSGIAVRRADGTTIALDPSKSADCHFTFVSHAHVDHLHRRSRPAGKGDNSSHGSKLIVSRATSLLASARGYDIADGSDDDDEEHDGFQLVDTGHILGSRGLLVGDDEVFYTGDLSTRERAFLKPARLPHARTLIIESTFGRPEYSFPAIDEITHKTNKIISEMYDMGIPVILMGYALGKAQVLTKLFGHWDPVFVHDSVAKMNAIHSDLGVELKHAMGHTEAEEKGLLSKRRPWVMVAPLMSGRNAFVKRMKERYGAVTVGFSGWAVDPRYRYTMGLDYAMPFSDHCDYEELMQAVRQCSPEQVFTFHGFSEEFAASLKRMGFDAKPIAGHEKKKEERRKKEKVATLDSFRSA